MIVDAARKNKFGAGLTAGLVIVVIAAAVFGVYSFLQRSRHVPFEHFSIENLTNNGHVYRAALSPDGKYLLHVREENGLQSLWLRHVATMSDTQVVPPAATRYAGLTFSPDGSYIYCVRQDEAEHTLASLYRAPVLGGTPQLLIKDVDSPITFSPDGLRFAYMRERHSSPFWDLLIAHSDGTPDRALFSNAPLASNSYEPAWSPDGKTIVIPVGQPTPDTISGLEEVDVATGKHHSGVLSADRLYFGAVWLPDGSGLVMSTVSMMTSLHGQLTLVSYPRGEFRQLTTDTNDYFHPSVSGRRAKHRGESVARPISTRRGAGRYSGCAAAGAAGFAPGYLAMGLGRGRAPRDTADSGHSLGESDRRRDGFILGRATHFRSGHDVRGRKVFCLSHRGALRKSGA